MIKLTRAEIAEAILGKVEWKTDEMGFAFCPGSNLHTNPSSRRDCAVYLQNIPTIFCVHSSCSNAIAAANHQFRSNIGKEEWGTKSRTQIPRKPTAAERVARQALDEAAARAASLERRSQIALPQILQEFALDPADLWEASPVRLLGGPDNDWRLLLSLFHTDDVVWIGFLYHSGKLKHARNFRPVSEWLTHARAPGPLVVPACFKADSFARTNDNITARRFLVVESDDLSKGESCAVFQWARQFMRLRAVVDTGGKSLHGWFDLPPEDLLKDLATVLPQLGADEKVLRPSQPVRLPGFPRVEKGTTQALIYLDRRR